MGQPCSTTKTENKKQQPAVLEKAIILPTPPIIQKPYLVIIKQIPRYTMSKQLKLETDIDRNSVIKWKKNYQRSQRLQYDEQRINQRYEELRYKPGLSSISKNPYSLKFLKQASFVFNRQRKRIDLNLLGKILKEQKTVEKLKLSFGILPNLNSEELIRLFSWLKKLVRLQHLEIDLKRCLSSDNNNRVINELAKCLRRYAVLEVLKIKISRNSKFSDEELTVLGKGLERIRKLRKLTVIGNRLSKISKKGLEKFGSSLEKIKTLRELKLSFNEGWMINSAGFHEICRNIGKIYGLEKLVLSFDKCAKLVQDQVIGSLSSALRNLDRLTVFKIQAGNGNAGPCVIKFKNEKNLEELLKSLNKLPALTNIYLDLRSSNQWVQDEYEKSKNCRFYFASNPQMSLEEIKILAEFLKENQMITKIALDFEGFWVINDAGLKLLAKGLEENARITDIAFAFSQCGEITNKGLTYFFKCLNSLVLKSVKMSFDEACKVTDKEIMSFRQKFRGFRHLRCLYMDFNWSPLRRDTEIKWNRIVKFPRVPYSLFWYPKSAGIPLTPLDFIEEFYGLRVINRIS